MSEIGETAYAKLNLALHVRRRRTDGHHAIETLFAFCEEGDRLELSEAPGLVVTGPFAAALGTSPPHVDRPSANSGGGAVRGANLVTRAAEAYRARFGGAEAAFRLDKRLPVAAGLGGGSADAAAALRLLAWRDGVDPAALHGLAAELGADVPACLASITARGEGRGEVLRAAGDMAGVAALLVNPGVALATGPVFAGWDGEDRGALAEGPPLHVARAGRNDLEMPARALCPEVGEALALLDGRGATLVRMSGSGATCFALFAHARARDAAAAAVAVARPGWWRLATRLR